ncbi:helix-turn-helix domain-containing protein [Streptomyces sp. NPDC048484]|uniref:helix-turn-helix transcriptional regulator n=1 Tax=Streptomyces sp. NPDC048484 TaxID=3155146 RepID=UPI0034184815
MGGVPETHSGWTFLTNHARVLAAIDENPNTRIRDIAARCRLTERAVQKIISDLEEGGYLTHTRQGRTNEYRIQPGTILRHPADAGLSVSGLLSVLARHDAERDAERDASPQWLQPASVREQSPPAGQ